MKTISYTCYTCSDDDKQILSEIKDICTTVTTMDYSDSFENMTQTAEFYAAIVGNEKVSVGVKTGNLLIPSGSTRAMGQKPRIERYHGMVI